MCNVKATLLYNILIRSWLIDYMIITASARSHYYTNTIHMIQGDINDMHSVLPNHANTSGTCMPVMIKMKEIRPCIYTVQTTLSIIDHSC